MNRITSTITYGNDEWKLDAPATSYSYTVQLRYQGRQYTFPFWVGELAGEPTTFDAAHCVLSDAALRIGPATLATTPTAVRQSASTAPSRRSTPTSSGFWAMTSLTSSIWTRTTFNPGASSTPTHTER